MIPTDIPSYTDPKQAALLMKLAKDKVCLEIGAYYGFTTVCMAQTAKMVYSLDNHRGDIHLGRTDTLASYLHYLKKYKVLHKVAILIGETTEVLPRLSPIFDLAFIDATHTYEAVMEDVAFTLELLPNDRDTLIAFHDYEEPAEHTAGVTLAVDELIEEMVLEPVEREGTLLVCRPI